MIKNIFIIALWVLSIVYCQMLFAQTDQAAPDMSSNELIKLSATDSFYARKYKLGPNDIISISVYDSPEFTQEKIRVQPDGKIVIVPLGPIVVAGMTIDELHDLLIERYKYYLNDPRVTIKFEKPRPFVVYVAGAVLNPGSYELNMDPTQEFITSAIIIERKSPLLSNVLIAAGGLSYDADLEHVLIKNDLDKTEFEVNILELIEKGDANQDVYLVYGDSIVVPRLPTPIGVSVEKYKKFASSTMGQKEIPVKVLGYVNNPGLIKLDTTQSLTLNSALAAAGGYYKDTPYAPKIVYLSRIDNNGKLVTTTVNPMKDDVTLMPKDIIYVPEKPRPIVGRAFDYLQRVINPFNTFGAAYNNWALMFDPKRYNFVTF